VEEKVCQSSLLEAAQKHLSHLCSRISSGLMVDGAHATKVIGYLKGHVRVGEDGRLLSASYKSGT
jgi:hypothetical protein